MQENATILHLFVDVAAGPGGRPPFLGNAMRSAFGWSLRRLACITGAPSCQGCPLCSRCPYGVVFDPAPPEPPPHPSIRDGIPAYVLHPPAWSGVSDTTTPTRLSLGITLLPPALPHLGIIRVALERAWFGNHRFLGGATALGPWQSERPALPPSPPTPPDIPQPTSPEDPQLQGDATLVLDFQTPLRLEHHGQILKRGYQLTVADLARAVHRRLLQWDALSGTAWGGFEPLRRAWDDCRLDASAMRWVDQHRYSQRQQQSHPIGGLIGPLQLTGPAESLAWIYPALALCRWLNLGKRTSFGLGAFRLST